jgi:tripartite-type tricarboxylate transporter receptor subunit TctC
MNAPTRLLACIATAVCVGIPPLLAHAWPDKMVKLIVPAPAGGNFDAVARIFADGLSKKTGQTVIVENKAGAGGSIGTQAMLAAPTDGYTLLLTGSTTITETPQSMRMPFDPIKDLKPIVSLAKYQYLLVTAENLPSNDMDGLAKYLKSPNQKASFATGAVGTYSHIAGEMLNRRLGLNMVVIPFNGSPPALTAVVGKEVTMYLDGVVTSKPLLESGRLRAVGIAGSKRHPQFPNVPTFVEQGYPEFRDFAATMMVVANSKVPSATLENIHTVMAEVAASAQFGKQVTERGFDRVDAMPMDQLAKTVKSQYDWVGTQIKDLRIKP